MECQGSDNAKKKDQRCFLYDQWHLLSGPSEEDSKTIRMLRNRCGPVAIMAEQQHKARNCFRRRLLDPLTYIASVHA